MIEDYNPQVFRKHPAGRFRRGVSYYASIRKHNKGVNPMDKSLSKRRTSDLNVRSGLPERGVADISAAATTLLADVFTLYLKTKNFHWHMSGAHFRDYHLMLDDHGDELFAITDELAERVRKIGGSTIKSIGDVSRRQRIKDNDAEFVHPHEMLAELREDNAQLVDSMRALHEVCDEYNDVATASLLENWIDEGEKRVWFLFEITRSNG